MSERHVREATKIRAGRRKRRRSRIVGGAGSKSAIFSAPTTGTFEPGMVLGIKGLIQLEILGEHLITFCEDDLSPTCQNKTEAANQNVLDEGLAGACRWIRLRTSISQSTMAEYPHRIREVTRQRRTESANPPTPYAAKTSTQQTDVDQYLAGWHDRYESEGRQDIRPRKRLGNINAIWCARSELCEELWEYDLRRTWRGNRQHEDGDAC